MAKKKTKKMSKKAAKKTGKRVTKRTAKKTAKRGSARAATRKPAKKAAKKARSKVTRSMKSTPKKAKLALPQDLGDMEIEETTVAFIETNVEPERFTVQNNPNGSTQNYF